MKTNIVAIVMIAAAFFIGGCKKHNPGPNEVYIQSSGSDGFSPSSITVSKGTTIKWTNKESVKHTITSDNGLFDSGDLSKDGTFSFKFDSLGTWNYHCMHHSLMKAKVIVQ